MDLWPHQRDILGAAAARSRIALLLEMRLGKTRTAIAWSVVRTAGAGIARILVVGPTSALFAWESELWAVGEEHVYRLYTGSAGDRRRELSRLWSAEAGRHWALWNKEGWLANPETGDYPWSVVIIDESTFLKNPKAHVTKYFHQHFKYTAQRAILTGMPAPETLLDLWGQFAWLNRGRWMNTANFWEWRSRHFTDVGFPHPAWQPQGRSLALITAAVADQSFTLKREQVTELGLDQQKIYHVEHLELPAPLRKDYTALEASWMLNGEQAIWAVQVWSALRAMANGIVDGRLAWPGKIRRLTELLETGSLCSPLVVFSTRLLLVEEAAKALRTVQGGVAILTGATPPGERAKAILAYRAGRLGAICTQVQIASFGLDLSTAAAAVFLDCPPSLLVRLQAEDRIIGPQAQGPRGIVDLVTADSADADLHGLVAVKRWKTVLWRDALARATERRKDNVEAYA